jgi:cyanophycin synthetase
LIEALTTSLLDRFELRSDVEATYNFASGSPIFCLAFSEQNRFLTQTLLRLVIQFVGVIDPNRASMALSDEDEATLAEVVERLRGLLANESRISKSRTTQDLQRGLRDAGVPWLSLEEGLEDINFYQIGFGRQQRVMRGSTAHSSSHLGVTVSMRKSATVRFLSGLGFPTPRQQLVKDSGRAIEAAEKIGYPVVLKGDLGTLGQRVHVDLRNAEDIFEKYSLLTDPQEVGNALAGSGVVVEAFIPGRIFRVEVIAGEFFDAYDMMPAGVVGDGRHSVRQLVEIENQSPARGEKDDPEGSYVRLCLGEEELSVLRKHGRTPDSIPDEGEQVLLRANSNWSSGGTYRRISHLVHEDNRRMAERVAAAMGIDVLGIDVISADISKSHIDEPMTIIEVNHGPNVGSYFDAEAGEFVDNATRIVRRLCPNAQYGDVPVVLLKEAAISREVEALLCRGLSAMGYQTGLVNSEGASLDGKVVAQSEHLDPLDIDRVLLRDPTVGAAVISADPSSLAEHGIGAGGCDVAVLPSSSGEIITTPLWPVGITTAATDLLLVDCARLGAVIYVDNKQGLDLCTEANPAKIIAIFDAKFEGAEALRAPNRSWIDLSERADGTSQLQISLAHSGANTALNIPQDTAPLPFAVALAALATVKFHSSEPNAALKEALAALASFAQAH